MDGKNIPVFEVMTATNAIRNLIREAKLNQINSVIATSASEGMISMDNSLLKLYKDGVITKDTARNYAINTDVMEKRLQ